VAFVEDIDRQVMGTVRPEDPEPLGHAERPATRTRSTQLLNACSTGGFRASVMIVHRPALWGGDISWVMPRD
jgi:hypothetical protein